MNSPYLARDILSASLPLLSTGKARMEAIARLIPKPDHLQDFALVGDLRGHLILTGAFAQRRFPHHVIVIDSFRKNWASAFLRLTSLHQKDIKNFQFSSVQSRNLCPPFLKNVACRYYQFSSTFLPISNQLQHLQIVGCKEQILPSSSSLTWFIWHSKAHWNISRSEHLINLLDLVLLLGLFSKIFHILNPKRFGLSTSPYLLAVGISTPDSCIANHSTPQKIPHEIPLFQSYCRLMAISKYLASVLPPYRTVPTHTHRSASLSLRLTCVYCFLSPDIRVF
ncbi:hypothetical protein DL96DRAFT_571512 [Flagelloscypha sp. PMI_526]|nr:hypothetical protein DL96DRAFT_571512 [Flagelloscypha sp. PMI_526]